MKKIILPDTQLNQFVNAITQSLLKGKEFPEGTISGEEILEFAAHKQVNHFVLFQIYQDWNAHLQKLSHPYFDFNAPDVRQGLRQFLNILSQNIRVPASDFRKMLQHAVYNTLKLILNPEDALANFFFLNTESIPLKLYEKHSPYFKDFDFVLKALGRFFQKNNLEKVDKALFVEKFLKVIGIFEKKEARDIFEYQRELFQSLTGRDLAQFTTPPKPRNFYEEEEEEKEAKQVVAVPTAEVEVKAPLVEPQAEEAAAPETPVAEEKTVSQVEAPEATFVEPPAVAEKAEVPDWIKREQERRKVKEGDEENVSAEKEAPVALLEEAKPEMEKPSPEVESVAESSEVEEVATPGMPAAEVEASQEETTQESPVGETVEKETSTPVVELKAPVPPAIEAPLVKEPLFKAPDQDEKIGVPSIVEAVRKDKVEAPKVETPQAEAPQIEVPKVETPQAETPKVETPQAETPKVEAPAVEEEAKAPTINETVEQEKRTVSEMLKGAAEKPRSLNEMFAGGDKKPASSLLEKAQEKMRGNSTSGEESQASEKPEAQSETAPRKRVISLLQDPRARKAKAEEERKKAEAEAAQKAKAAEEAKAKAEAGASSGQKSTIDLFAEKKKEEKALKERIGDQQGSGKTIAKKLSEIQSIQTDQIPVHKQFQYVQKVFGGSSVKFKVVLDKINKTESHEEAEGVLERYVFNDPNVNRNDKVCREFEDLVRGRFSWDS